MRNNGVQVCEGDGDASVIDPGATTYADYLRREADRVEKRHKEWLKNDLAEKRAFVEEVMTRRQWQKARRGELARRNRPRHTLIRVERFDYRRTLGGAGANDLVVTLIDPSGIDPATVPEGKHRTLTMRYPAYDDPKFPLRRPVVWKLNQAVIVPGSLKFHKARHETLEHRVYPGEDKDEDFMPVMAEFRVTFEKLVNA
jgi:hypothetical protein